MPAFLRMLLILASILSTIYVIRKIRKAQLILGYSLFWLFVSFILVLFSVFPSVAVYCTRIIGIISPVNFIFMVLIFALLYKVFTLSIKVSQLESMIRKLTQEYTIRSKASYVDNKNQ